MKAVAVGLLAGPIAWYTAHEIGFYYSDYNCHHPWILPMVHILALLVALFGTWYSFVNWFRTKQTTFGALIGIASGLLFSLVILWQGLALFFFSGCDR
jgi:hypothetical protein